MAEKEKKYIFHVTRKDGSFLILHPFSTPEKFLYALEHSEIEGRYGSEPRVETLTMFRNELYRLVETAVKNWIFDQRFIPKFLISTGVFLVTYFFFSYVVRDPIPMVDETVLGLGAGILTYVMIGRKDMSSDRAMKKRVELRSKVDRIKFTESNFLKEVESLLYKNESGNFTDTIKQIVAPQYQYPGLGFEKKDEVLSFLRLLESKFNFKHLKKEEKYFKRFMNGRGEKPIMESKNIDYSLYAVYKMFKKNISTLK
ncbi:MAG: hypothetical protein DRP57_13455 [Spirochaetes bacterium]|nr:MAG: hypothetical protein DRP57_13455 [Spirochaetota bacterium]